VIVEGLDSTGKEATFIFDLAEEGATIKGIGKFGAEDCTYTYHPKSGIVRIDNLDGESFYVNLDTYDVTFEGLGEFNGNQVTYKYLQSGTTGAETVEVTGISGNTEFKGAIPEEAKLQASGTITNGNTTWSWTTDSETGTIHVTAVDTKGNTFEFDMPAGTPVIGNVENASLNVKKISDVSGVPSEYNIGEITLVASSAVIKVKDFNHDLEWEGHSLTTQDAIDILNTGLTNPEKAYEDLYEYMNAYMEFLRITDPDEY